MKSRFSAAAVLIAGVATMTGPAFAQKISPDDFVKMDSEREIVVSAQPDNPELDTDEIRRQARHITAATNIFDDSLSMFHKRLCPGVSGLPVDLANLIADRIRFNAERIGLELDRGGECRPNLMVNFVVSGRDTLRDLANQKVKAFGDISLADQRRLLNEAGPVRAWQIESLKTRDGAPISQDPKDNYQVVSTQSANSLILLPSRNDIEYSIVVIDLPAIDGLSAVQIADYATMRGLAKTRPVEGDAAYSTILNLFDENSLHPLELTTFDIAYLKNLYGDQPNIIAAAKIGGVKGAMRKEIAAAQAENALSE